MDVPLGEKQCKRWGRKRTACRAFDVAKAMLCDIEITSAAFLHFLCIVRLVIYDHPAPNLLALFSSSVFPTMAQKLILPFYVLFHPFPLHSFASNSGKLALFLDGSCLQASIINPTVDVPIDTCLVTTNVQGIAIELFPPCASGTATFNVYQDTSCANVDSYEPDDKCYFELEGISAIAFVCNEVAGGGVVTATSVCGFSKTPPLSVIFLSRQTCF